MKSRPKSKRTYEELCEVIPGGVNSPVRACSGMGQLPLVVERGEGDTITDEDGNSYIDYCGSWGALIHGHAHPTVIQAVQKRAAWGTSFGITTAIEGELARHIIRHYPSVEKIRFVSSGTEATMSAARLARGFTGKEIVIKFSGNYHGHADFFLIKAGSGAFRLHQSSSAGIPTDHVKHTISLNFNDCEAVEALFRNRELNGNIAAIIVEPIAGNMGLVPATAEFLNLLREGSTRVGALLILDEVITGFRVARGGAQSLYGVVPDLTCFGKIIGGGFPAAAFGGRREVMDCLAPIGSVYQAGTLSGNPVAMEAGLQAIQLLEKEGFYEELQRKADIITVPVREALRHQNACIQQIGSMFTLFFGKKEVKSMEDAKESDLEEFARFFRFMFERGVYMPPSQHEAAFVSMAHSEEHLKKTRDLMLEFLD